MSCNGRCPIPAVQSPIHRSRLRKPEQRRRPIADFHRGLISTSPLPSDLHGRVYFCGTGRMYWRYDAHVSGLYAPLRYPKGM